jgi:folylpolyglutamate synthase/dihydropteroate synthase
VGGTVVLGGAQEAADAFLGRHVPLAESSLAGRLELRPDEVRDGAHTPDAVDWLLERLPGPHDYVVVASILGDKDADGILERLAGAGKTIVATRSSNVRALPAADVAERAAAHFPAVELEDDPRQALARAHALGARVLVTGSLYLLADLASAE